MTLVEQENYEHKDVQKPEVKKDEENILTNLRTLSKQFNLDEDEDDLLG
ncbi:MAG: hypothetical protein OQJ97_07335 [Rhodospirillales bacterium]|nr:hypothetical protein [Rhodospirillales bacterium]